MDIGCPFQISFRFGIASVQVVRMRSLRGLALRRRARLMRGYSLACMRLFRGPLGGLSRLRRWSELRCRTPYRARRKRLRVFPDETSGAAAFNHLKECDPVFD